MKIDTKQVEIKNPPASFQKFIVLGGIAALASLAGIFVGGSKQFYFSSLTAGIFWMGIPLGALFFVLIHYLVGAKWSVVIRRMAENMAYSGPIIAMVVAILTIVAGKYLFPWLDHDVASHDHLIQKKQAYLNLPFFIARNVFYVATWFFLTRFLYKKSLLGDQSQVASNDSAKTVSPVGIILYSLTVTFAAFDWIMSLDPHWYSTIFGVYIFAGFVVSFFAMAILVFQALHKNNVLQGIVTVEHYHDLGKLMFAFVCFWAFCAFSQYMLIWYGNIPEETIFYKHRWVGAWSYVSLVLPFGHFVLPFVLLMSRVMKRKLKFLSAMAVWVLVMHFVDLHWLILPNLHHEGFHFSWLDVTTFFGFGGLFFWALGRLITKSYLIPVKDPDLEISLHHVSR